MELQNHELSDWLVRLFKNFFDKIYVSMKKRLLHAKFKVLAKISDRHRKYITSKFHIIMSKDKNSTLTSVRFKD